MSINFKVIDLTQEGFADLPKREMYALLIRSNDSKVRYICAFLCAFLGVGDVNKSYSNIFVLSGIALDFRP